MDKYEVMTQTLRWVIGYCWEWNQHAKQFPDNSREFQDFCHRTHMVVWKFVQNEQGLDGSCSDLECTAAIEARRVFAPLLKN